MDFKTQILVPFLGAATLVSSNALGSNCREVFRQYEALTFSQKTDAFTNPDSPSNREAAEIFRKAWACKRSDNLEDILASTEHDFREMSKIEIPTVPRPKWIEREKRAKAEARRRAREAEKRRRQDALERFCRDNREEEFCGR